MFLFYYLLFLLKIIKFETEIEKLCQRNDQCDRLDPVSPARLLHAVTAPAAPHAHVDGVCGRKLLQ